MLDAYPEREGELRRLRFDCANARRIWMDTPLPSRHEIPQPTFPEDWLHWYLMGERFMGQMSRRMNKNLIMFNIST